MKITIVGHGVWGQAIHHVVSQNHPEVQIAGRHDSLRNQEVVIICTPTQAYRDILQRLSFSGKPRVVVNTSKGIEAKSHRLPFEIVEQTLGSSIEYYTLIGPSFAAEVSTDMPTLVNLGYSRKSTHLTAIQKLFQTPNFSVKATKGVEVLELSAAFKNIYAIACGLSDGIGYGMNTRVKLLTLALEEQQKLAKALGYRQSSDMIAGTLGDLVLTCNSPTSRNFLFGKYLASMKISAALKTIDSTVEGYNSLASVEFFEKKGEIELPLASFVKKIAEQNNPKVIRKRLINLFVVFNPRP